jgi:serine/threonine protein kinase
MHDFEPRWKLLKPLPEGGQAHTYIVESAETPGLLGAAKRLKNLRREGRFEKEIEALRRLNHPNVLRLLDFGTTPKDLPYLVAEYCPNGELKPEFFKGKTLIEIVRFFRQICAGVAAAHRDGVIHRDLKPSNIFLGKGYEPIVGDFGICFLTEDGMQDSRLTETYEVVASRWFGAPEARNGRLSDVKPSADVYSLGKLLHWMASGGKLFDREEHRSGSFKLEGSSDLDPNPELIHELLDETITPMPDGRLPTAVDLMYKVDELISRMEAGGHAVGLEVPQRCIFCGSGRYEVVVNALEGGARDAAQSLFGWASPSSPPAAWLILACNLCGNVQVFRPDLPEPKSSGAKFAQISERKKRWTKKRNP